MPLTWNYKNFEVSVSDAKHPYIKILTDALPNFIAGTQSDDEPALSLPYKTDDLDEILEHAKRIAATSEDVLVLGIGGSSLGGQALIQACGPYPDDQPTVTFPDNLAPVGFPHLLSGLNPEHTHVIAISKSGNTMETHAQLAITMEWLSQAHCEFKDHITVVTEPKPSALSKLAGLHDLPSLEHSIALGGRFSVLSIVGLLPAAVAGVDIAQVRMGARAVVDQMKSAKTVQDIPSAIGAAHIISQHKQNNLGISVLLPYADRLSKFGDWYCQLWAESLGKAGHGTTPVVALGPLDQHSQLQLYMEGPKDKSFSFITIDRADNPAMHLPHTLNDIGMDSLAGLTLHDLVKAMSEGTRHALTEIGQPVRHAHIHALNEESIGALFMHFLLETLFGGALLGVDPYGQPGVERCKILASEFLEKLKN